MKTKGSDNKMKSNKLKGKIIEKGFNVEQVAERIGMDKATFYRKLNNFEKFTVGDALKIKKALELSDTEAYDIFLS